jgi:hypothetical protein
MNTESNKLQEGWYRTINKGEIFVTPSGKAFTVQATYNQLKSVQVNISPKEIIKTTAIEKVKHAQEMRQRRKTKVIITNPPKIKPKEATEGGVL